MVILSEDIRGQAPDAGITDPPELLQMGKWQILRYHQGSHLRRPVRYLYSLEEKLR